MSSPLPHKTVHALGGSAVLGEAHLGVLKTLQEHKVKIDCITGSKIGALVVSFCVFGKSFYEIEAIASELSCLDATYFISSKCGLLSKK